MRHRIVIALLMCILCAAAAVAQPRGEKERLLRQLRDPDSHVRLQAVEALESFDAPGVTDALIGALKDPAPVVRGRAIRALRPRARTGSTPAGAVIEVLRDPDANVRLSALRVVSGIQDARIRQALKALAKDPDRYVRQAAAAALAEQTNPSMKSLLAALDSPQAQARVDAIHRLHLLGGQPPEVFDRLVAALHDPSPRVRIAAAQSFWGYEAVAPLVAATRDPVAGVRLAATQALGGFRAKRAIGPLAALLRDPDLSVRREAAFALATIRDPRGLDIIAKALQDPSERTRLIAVQSLGQLGDPRSADLLFPLLRGGTSRVRASAADSLGMIRDPRAVGPLLAVLRGSDPMPRAAAIGALAKIRTEPAMAAVAAHLGDKNYNVRVRAINALAEMGEPAVPALAAALRQSDPRARVAAATALGGMCQRPERRNAAAVSTLAAALNDDSADVRRVAIEYLDRAFRHDGSRLAGAEGKVAFSPSLVAAARNHEPATRASALRLLGHTRDRRAFNLLVAALGDPEVVVRTGAATGLATLGDKRAVGPMIAMLGDRHPWARSSAASLLPRFGDARTVAPLVGALGDRDSGVRASAAQSLMRLKDPRGKAFLLSGLKDPDPKTRKEMVATVAQFVERAWFESDQKSRHRAGPPPRLPEYAWAVEPLIALLGDPDAGVRQEGAGALGMIGDRRAVRPLIRLLRDDSLAVRPIAAGALGKLQDEAAVGPLITLLKTLEVTGRGGPPPFFSSGRGRDPAEYIGLMAVSALSDITGEHLGYDAAAWETWWQQRQASTASSGWKNPRYLALFGALLALIVGLGLFVIIRRRRAGQPAPAAK